MVLESSSIFSKKNMYRKSDINDKLTDAKEILGGALIRVSTDMQVTDGDSLEMQHELAQEHMDKLGGKVYKFYVEEGLSASKTRVEKRDKLQELMQDIRDGKVNYVIAYKRDRMFRNSIEHMEFLRFLAEHDCEIFFSARGEMQLDLSTFKAAGVSKMLESILSMMAEMEAEQTSARVSDTMISKAFKGERTGGRLPFGYKQEGEMVVPIEGAKEIIEIVEDLYLSGYGVKSISAWLNGGEVKGLNKLETPYPKFATHSKTQEWNQRNVKTILFNPIYTGHNSYQSRKNIEMDRIVMPAPSVVPLRTLERQQQIFELQEKKTNERKPPRAYNTPFILTGLIYCGECGQPLKTQTSQKREGVRYSYYKCGHRDTDKAQKCNMSRIYRKEILEKLVLELTKEKMSIFWNSNAYDIFYKKSAHAEKIATSHIEAIADKIKDVDEKITGYAKMIVELNKNKETELTKVYLKEQKHLMFELNELKEAHAKMIEDSEKTEEDVINFEKFLEVAKNYSKIIENAPIGKQKQILETLFTKIYIDQEGVVELDFNFGINKSNELESPESNSHVDGKLKTPSFIGFDTIRDRTVPKGINGNAYLRSLDITMVNEWTATFNYFDTLRKMFEKVRVSFYPYLCHLDPKFDIKNVGMIDEDELIGYITPPQKSRVKTKKLYTYIQQKLNITKTTRTRLVYGHLPPYDKIKEYLNLLDSNIVDFFSYVKTQYPDFIINESLFEEVEATVNSKTVKTQFLFKDLIKCKKCGSFYVGKKEGKGVRYSCVKNRPDGKYRCYSNRIKEPVLIELFESETNMKIDRSLLLQMVDGIDVVENDKARIIYKE